MRSRIAALGAIPVLVVAVGLVLSGCSAHPTEAYSKLAHLDQGTMLASGQAPPVVSGTESGSGFSTGSGIAPASELVRSSLRMLTVHDGTEFWVGATRDDDVCFIAQGAQNETECVDADRFGRYGITMELSSPDLRVWLHTEYMTVSANWVEISPSIAVRD
jgi:hypothetical protein